VHHYLPGMGLALAAGGTAILTRTDGREFWLSLPFGTGAGLTLDELALLVKRDNPLRRPPGSCRRDGLPVLLLSRESRSEAAASPRRPPGWRQTNNATASRRSAPFRADEERELPHF
jgi:hypothetical protein